MNAEDDISIADSIPPGRFPAWFEKALLEAIEAHGGIARTLGKDHHLRTVCNSNTDFFGTENSSIRIRVGKRVAKLQAKFKDSKKKYLKYLEDAGVLPFSERVGTSNANISSQQSVASDISVDSSTGTSDESESVLQRPTAVAKGKRGPKSKKKKASQSLTKASQKLKKAPVCEVSVNMSEDNKIPDHRSRTVLEGLKSPNAFNEAEEVLIVPDDASEYRMFICLLSLVSLASLSHTLLFLQLSLMSTSSIPIATVNSWCFRLRTFLTSTMPTMSGQVSLPA